METQILLHLVSLSLAAKCESQKSQGWSRPPCPNLMAPLISLHNTFSSLKVLKYDRRRNRLSVVTTRFIRQQTWNLTNDKVKGTEMCNKYQDVYTTTKKKENRFISLHFHIWDMKPNRVNTQIRGKFHHRMHCKNTLWQIKTKLTNVPHAPVNL